MVYLDMCVSAKDVDGNAKAFTKQVHCLESLLVVGTTAPDKYFDGVYDELILVFFQGMDGTLECGRHVCGIHNTATNDQDLAIGLRHSAHHQINCR